MWEFPWECEGLFLTLSCTLGSMQHDSWAPLLAHNLVAPCLGREPKVRVATKDSQMRHIGFPTTLEGS